MMLLFLPCLTVQGETEMVSSDFGTNVRSVPVNIPQVRLSIARRVSLWIDRVMVGDVEEPENEKLIVMGAIGIFVLCIVSVIVSDALGHPVNAIIDRALTMVGVYLFTKSQSIRKASSAPRVRSDVRSGLQVVTSPEKNKEVPQ